MIRSQCAAALAKASCWDAVNPLARITMSNAPGRLAVRVVARDRLSAQVTRKSDLHMGAQSPYRIGARLRRLVGIAEEDLRWSHHSSWSSQHTGPGCDPGRDKQTTAGPQERFGPGSEFGAR